MCTSSGRSANIERTVAVLPARTASIKCARVIECLPGSCGPSCYDDMRATGCKGDSSPGARCNREDILMTADKKTYRRPWLAALLHFALPGLGHLYSGRPLRALVLHLITLSSPFLGYLALAW